MPIRDALTAVLRGDTAAELTPAERTQLESLAQEAHAAGEITHVRDECAARVKQAGASFGVEYLLAGACALNGEIERAHQTLLALGDKLGAAKSWEPLAAVAERALGLEETHAAARLLVRAHEGLKVDPARLDALERAWAINPDDLELALLLAVRLGDAGRGSHRRALLAELLQRFATDARYSGLEEAALEFAEQDDADGLVRLFETLPLVAQQGAHKEAAQLTAIAFPPLARSGRAGESAAPLRKVATLAIEQQGPTGGEPYRQPLATAYQQGLAGVLPDPAPVFALSGIEDPMKPLLPALDRLDLIATLPPGRTVLHGSFGAGRITTNDGETVAIDFAHARGHRMPYAAAKRTLTPIADDDLRLLLVSHKEKLAKMRAEQPTEVMWRALKAIGGAADAQKLKVFLVGSQLVPAADWTTFWRKARGAAEKDPRIDTSRAFEQHYRVAVVPDPKKTSAPELPPLPALELRKSVKTNLSTLRKFLSQHPQAEEALGQRFGRYIVRAVTDEEGERGDRARAGLYFARWFPERAMEWRDILRRLWEQGLVISDLSGEEEQLALLEVSHAAGVESDAILSALDSRFSAVRTAAEVYREQLDDHGRLDMRRTLLRHATRYPMAALRLVEEALSGKPEPAESWRMLISALSLIEERPKPSVAEKVLRWLEPGESFERAVAGTSCPEELGLQIRVLVRQWRSSDRYFFPVLEALERLGLTEEVALVRGNRKKNTEKLFERVGQQSEETDSNLMTRATWKRLKAELDRLDHELRTTIPATIQKARELGDHKENAEYHSATLKQSNVSKLVASLQLRLSRARFVEDVAHKDGIVGVGTEVVLESERDVITYWILGEGEHHHGDHVISFQTPVGRSLMGRTVGDQVDLGEGDQRRPYRIVSIDRKLPTNEPAS